jgi:hypothetical protein
MKVAAAVEVPFGHGDGTVVIAPWIPLMDQQD